MPRCFELRRKNSESADPLSKTAVHLVTIDEEMCAYFGIEPDKVKWHYDWHDNIGMCLALGKTFQDQGPWDPNNTSNRGIISVLLAELTEFDQLVISKKHDKINDAEYINEERVYRVHILAIAKWLDDNFTPNAWWEGK